MIEVTFGQRPKVREGESLGVWGRAFWEQEWHMQRPWGRNVPDVFGHRGRGLQDRSRVTTVDRKGNEGRKGVGRTLALLVVRWDPQKGFGNLHMYKTGVSLLTVPGQRFSFQSKSGSSLGPCPSSEQEEEADRRVVDFPRALRVEEKEEPQPSWDDSQLRSPGLHLPLE